MLRFGEPTQWAAGVSFILIGSAHAEIGLPTGPGGYYVAVEGGWQFVDTAGVAGFTPGNIVNGNPGGGTNASLAVLSSEGATANQDITPDSAASIGTAAGSISQVLISLISGTESASLSSDDRANSIKSDDGGFLGLSFGYAFSAPVLTFTRLEVYGTGSNADDEKRSIGAFALRSVDNNAVIAFASIPIENTVGKLKQDQQLREIGVRLKSDHPTETGVVSLSGEPFYMNYEQTTVATGQMSQAIGANLFQAFATRRADVEADIFGAQLALEAEYPLFGGRFSWIGRGSAGVYHVDAEGRFSSQGNLSVTLEPDVEGVFGQVATKQDDSEVGYRLGAETGVRLRLKPWALVSFTGSVDYLSDVPTAVLPGSPGDRAAHVAFDDLTDWRVGVRLTFATQREAEALK